MVVVEAAWGHKVMEEMGNEAEIHPLWGGEGNLAGEDVKLIIKLGVKVQSPVGPLLSAVMDTNPGALVQLQVLSRCYMQVEGLQ